MTPPADRLASVRETMHFQPGEMTPEMVNAWRVALTAAEALCQAVEADHDDNHTTLSREACASCHAALALRAALGAP